MKKRDALKVVKKLGFSLRHGKELFAKYKHEGQLVLTTAVPKGRGDLHFESAFRKQLCLNRVQLDAAVRCPFRARHYVEHLRKIKKIPEQDP